MKGKFVIAGSHVLQVSWNRAELVIKENSTVIYSGRPFLDILDFEDIIIDTAGNALFLVHTIKSVETSSSYASDAYEPKHKYPSKTMAEVLESRTINSFVTLA